MAEKVLKAGSPPPAVLWPDLLVGGSWGAMGGLPPDLECSVGGSWRSCFQSFVPGGGACQPQARVVLACAENAGWLASCRIPGTLLGPPFCVWHPSSDMAACRGAGGAVGLQGHTCTCQVPQAARWVTWRESLPSGAGMAGVRVAGASTSHPALMPPPFPCPTALLEVPGAQQPVEQGQR